MALTAKDVKIEPDMIKKEVCEFSDINHEGIEQSPFHSVYIKEEENIDLSEESEIDDYSVSSLENDKDGNDDNDLFHPQAKRRRHGLQQKQEGTSLIVDFDKPRLKGWDGHLWSTKPPSSESLATLSQNSNSIAEQGPTNLGKLAESPLDCFNLFFDEDFIEEIVKYTNITINTVAKKYNPKYAGTVEKVSSTEMKAFIGILLASGAKQDNFATVENMWHIKFGHDIYRVAMTEKRFKFLLQSLTFDDESSREERIKEDKFAPIRHLWESFNDKCKLHYSPGVTLTVGEMSLTYQGVCDFKTSITGKDKSVIKFHAACDSESKYMLNVMPYLGKKSFPSEYSEDHYFTKELLQPYMLTKRNVISDTSLTSLELIKDILNHSSLSILGSTKPTASFYPPEMNDKVTRKGGGSAFCYDGSITLVSYKPMRGKSCHLISTLQHQANISNTGKPEILELFNEHRNGVNDFEHLLNKYSCLRQTRKWPMCIFFFMLNALASNAWIIHSSNQIKHNKKKISIYLFMMELALELIAPWAKERLTCAYLPSNLKTTIKNMLDIETPIHESNSLSVQLDKAKRCFLCPRPNVRKSRVICQSCMQPVCPSHYKAICLGPVCHGSV